MVRLETFTLRHPIRPRRGPSIAWASGHEYVLVKLTDRDGVVGWGESYLVPGIVETLRDLAPIVLGRPAGDILRTQAEVRWAGGGPYARSALAIALDDLRARQLGVSVATLYGGSVRDRVKLYAASGGYVEGEDPELTWPREANAVVEAGFGVMKLRIGRYPIAREKALLERLRRDLSSSLDLAADGNAGYTFGGAVRMGKILGDLGFLWFEEPLNQWGGYAAYERLAEALEITLSGGEVLMSRPAAAEFLAWCRGGCFRRCPGADLRHCQHAAHLEFGDRHRRRPPGPGRHARSHGLAGQPGPAARVWRRREPVARAAARGCVRSRGRLADDSERSWSWRGCRRGLRPCPRGLDVQARSRRVTTMGREMYDRLGFQEVCSFERSMSSHP